MGDPADFVARVVPARQPGAAAPPLVVLLHGIGADEHDLLPLGRFLDPRCQVVSLRAPRDYVVGYAWFPIDFRPDGSVVPDVAAARATLDDLRGWLADAPARFGTDPDRTFLLGFSQGAMMSLGVLLHGARATGGRGGAQRPVRAGPVRADGAARGDRARAVAGRARAPRRRAADRPRPRRARRVRRPDDGFHLRGVSDRSRDQPGRSSRWSRGGCRRGSEPRRRWRCAGPDVVWTAAMQDIDPSAWVAPSAQLYGAVTVGPGASVWHNVVMRAECHAIRIGRLTNIQDFVMIHVAYERGHGGGRLLLGDPSRDAPRLHRRGRVPDRHRRHRHGRGGDRPRLDRRGRRVREGGHDRAAGLDRRRRAGQGRSASATRRATIG